MHYYEIAPNKIVRAGSNFFTYSSDDLLKIGQIVSIEVGKKQIIGVIFKKVTKPSYPTKLVTKVLDIKPLPVQLLDLSLWLSKYYTTALAVVLQTILPTGIQKKRRDKELKHEILKTNRTKNVFNDDQKNVIDIISKQSSGTFLLQGVTGSGKTEIYIDTAKKSIANGRSVIILVPEIALTSQLISEFSNHFDNLLVTHSKMTEANRHTVWAEALNDEKPRVVIGPRSALFTPLTRIGVIIIDEAHEPSYKQEQSPKYSALRVASVLGKLHKAKVILGSATPNIVDRYLAERSINPILKLDKVAKKDSIPPKIILVDMTKKENHSGHRFISQQLVSQIEHDLAEKKQILIFHNRRGSASTTLCEDCGWSAECPKCYIPLALHSDHHYLMCHICGFKSNIPTSCPTCKKTGIIHKGIGTKLIESELMKLFPNANIARFDGDNNNEETVHRRYDDLFNGEIDIIIGTQVIAKGLDLPKLRTVGVIQADSGLALPDFSTDERIFQLLAQVVGRVGRNEHQSNVIVQTYQPNHPSITYGLSQDYEKFYKNNLKIRRIGKFPPFVFLLKLTCSYKTESAAINNSKKMAIYLKDKLGKDVQILGPTPSFYERYNDKYRWQLILKSTKREHLINIIEMIPAKNWQFDLDPTSLL